jgi:hypothetical protein
MNTIPPANQSISMSDLALEELTTNVLLSAVIVELVRNDPTAANRLEKTIFQIQSTNKFGNSANPLMGQAAMNAQSIVSNSRY